MRLFAVLICTFLLNSCFKQDLKTVKVLKLFDGDSFLAQDYPCLDCKSFQVRLLGIDAPESKQGIWGDKARSKLKSLIAKNQLVFLEYDYPKLDKYKRHLAFAYADEGRTRLINELMISSGHAELFAFSNDLKYIDRFKAAEVFAKESQRGIWDKEAGLKQSPYKYRKSKKS